eukprot:Skav226158  [mRNA]  locus=scaffold3275:61414:63369:+ [translate_table: standard]
MDHPVTVTKAHHLNLTSMQMRQLLGVYQYSELREEALITTFFRIIVPRQWGQGGGVQGIQVTYDFDFAKYDQRLAANVFFNLANAEKRDNIANFRYTLPDGTIDKLEQGVPRSWDTFSSNLVEWELDHFQAAGSQPWHGDEDVQRFHLKISAMPGPCWCS